MWVGSYGSRVHGAVEKGVCGSTKSVVVGGTVGRVRKVEVSWKVQSEVGLPKRVGVRWGFRVRKCGRERRAGGNASASAGSDESW